MFLTSFIFDKKQYDDDFYKLDKKIEDFSKSIAGFIGMESFTDAQTGRLINNYYWDNREGLELLMSNVEHLRAKEQSSKWISGFQVVIAKIEGAHNVNLDHPLSQHPMPYREAK